MTPKTKAVLDSLRTHAENSQGEWSSIYLDNGIPEGMSRRAYAGHLSALKDAGYYRPYDDGDNDGIWGEVKLTD